jgi:hypothetical protein
MATCLDYGIDYAHSPVWCPACSTTALDSSKIHNLQQRIEWLESKLYEDSQETWKPRPNARPRSIQYILPNPSSSTSESNERGGMSIEPQRRITGE